MSRAQTFNSEARRLEESQNEDIAKLTRYQLERAYYDLSKGFSFYKNLNDRLGIELKTLYNRFQLHPRPENAELYKALQGNPELHKYINAFQPLLEAYEKKIQDFQNAFENLNDEFIQLDNNFERMLIENQELRKALNETNKQLLEVYANGSNQKIHADFGQMILAQLNDKQKLLVQANTIMQRQSHKYKSENNRLLEQLKSLKDKNQKNTIRIKELQISNNQLQNQLKTLKENIFDLKMKNNNLQIEKKKIDQAHQRAQSQLTKMNKQSDLYKEKYQTLKQRISKNVNWQPQTDQQKLIEQLKTEIEFLKAQQGPNGTNKKYDKLQRDYDQLLRQKNKINENLQSYKIKEQVLNEEVSNLRSKIANLENEKKEHEIAIAKMKRNQQQLIQNHKDQIARLKNQYQRKIQELQQKPHNTGQNRIVQIQHQLSKTQQQLNEAKLELDKLYKQFGIKGDKNKNDGAKAKQAERALTRLKQKLKMQEEIFSQQSKLLQDENKALKEELELLKHQRKQHAQSINDLKRQLQKARFELSQLTEQKQSMIEQIRRVRNQYQTTLRQKEKLFQSKIKEIKELVDEIQKRKKIERQRIQQVAKQHRKIVQEIKITYEQRINQLEEQHHHPSNSKKW